MSLAEMHWRKYRKNQAGQSRRIWNALNIDLPNEKNICQVLSVQVYIGQLKIG